jgi:hypothetical protein
VAIGETRVQRVASDRSIRATFSRGSQPAISVAAPRYGSVLPLSGWVRTSGWGEILPAGWGGRVESIAGSRVARLALEGIVGDELQAVDEAALGGIAPGFRHFQLIQRRAGGRKGRSLMTKWAEQARGGRACRAGPLPVSARFLARVMGVRASFPSQHLEEMVFESAHENIPQAACGTPAGANT